jgi:hypothetical protein
MSWQVEAHLFGGTGNGLLIRVDELQPRVTVFRNGGPPFAMTGVVDEGACPGAVCMGVYELAGSIGPDEPTYVASSL